MKLYQLDWAKANKQDKYLHFRLVGSFDDGPEADERYRAAFEAGLYEHVADVEGGDLEFLYSATNNGVLSPFWSRIPPEGVSPVRPAYRLGHDGERLGLRSTSVGDIVELEGRLHVVASLGFRDIGPVPSTKATPAA